MSRYESSTFIHDTNIMNVDVLKRACDTLGWKYYIKEDELIVTDAKQEHQLFGEFALKVNIHTNQATYNTYYMPDAFEKVSELEEQFYLINAEYAREALISEFKKKGFIYKTDLHFHPNMNERYRFYLEGRSYDKNEDEPIARIKFSILHDGTIVTDSDYLPNDVNVRAHAAMDELEKLLGNERKMVEKNRSSIPAKHLAKMIPRKIYIENKHKK